MSTTTSSDDAISVYDNEELTQIIKQQQQQINELEEITQQQQETINELQEQLTEHQEHDGQRTAELNQRVSNVEDEINDIANTESREGGSSVDNSEGEDEETTALERICALPEHVVEENLTRNQQRARSVAQLVEEIGKVVPAGIAITSSRIKRALSAREDKKIHRQTASRVADFLEQFGGELVSIEETRSGKTTVVFDEQLVEDVTHVVTEDNRGGVTPTVV